MSGTGVQEVCKELLAVPLPRGVLLLTGPMTQQPDPTVVAAALAQEHWGDAVPVFLVEDAQSVPVRRYLAGLSDQARAPLVVVPWPCPGLPGALDAASPRVDAESLEHLADFYEVPVQVPAQSVVGPVSPRVVPVDVDGRETLPAGAHAVRVLPRTMAAMRESLRAAVQLADEAPPSWQLLMQGVEQVAAIRARLRVPWRVAGDEVATWSPWSAAYVLAAYVARYGVPDGLDVTTLTQPVRPIGLDQLSAALGRPSTQIDPDALLRGLAAAPGSAALVRFAPAGSGIEQLMWLMSDGRPGTTPMWVELHNDGDNISAVVAGPTGEDRRMVALRDPGARVLPVDANGRPTTLAALLAGVPEAVRQYGSQLDGVQGFEYVTPLPESVVAWLREQVTAEAGARGARAAFGTQLDRQLTATYLFAEWPRLRCESGLPLSIPADGGQTTWLRVVLRDAAAEDPGIEQLPDGPPVAFQRWAFGGWEMAETAIVADVRSMNLPFRFSREWPVENGSAVRQAVLTMRPGVTYNQMSTSVTVTGGMQALTLLRSRERSWPYSYEMRWQMRVGGDVNRPWIDLAPPPDRLTVWFPKHLVENPPANAERPQPPSLDTLRDDVPLFGVQSVANADRIFRDVMASFQPQLASLSKASERDLQEFFDEYSLRANIPLMWTGTHPSPMLFEEDGSVIGYLRVRTSLVAREVTGPATQDAVLESHVLRILRVEGSAEVTNAVGLDGSVTVGMSKAPADPGTGVEPTGGTVRGQIGARHQVSHALGSGGGARTSHSLRTRKPLIPLPVDMAFEVELVRPAGAAVRPEPRTPLGSGTVHRAILRVPSADVVTTRPTTPRYLPLEIAQLRSLGVSTTPLRVTGVEPLFASVEIWLRERGFLPPDADADRLADKATQIHRLQNASKLDKARSGMGPRGAVDEMIEGGFPIVFELPGRGDVQRVEVRISAERRFTDEPEGGVVHNLVLPDVQTLNWTGSTLPAGEKRTRSPFGWNVGLAGSYSNPFDRAGYGRPLQSFSSGLNRFSGPATITENSIGFGQELYALSPSGEGSQSFEVPVRLRMDVSWSHGEAPEPSSVDGTFTLAVPTYRTLTQPVEVRPYQIPVAREVTDQDLAGLNQPDGDVFYRNGVLRLPELAYVDRVEGSRSIRAVVSDLVGAVRHAAAATEEPNACDLDMPGAFPLAGAVRPSPVEADTEMRTLGPASLPEDRALAMPGAFPLGEAAWPVAVADNELVADDPASAQWGGAGRAVRWLLETVVDGWTWAKRRATGEPLNRLESMGQEVAHAAVSPHHLAANALQIFNNQYVSENIGGHGMVWGTDVSVTVEGYLTDVETLPPPGTMDMECWLQSLDGSSQTDASSSLYEVPVTVTGTYGSNTRFAPSGTYTHDRRTDARTTFSDNTMAFRVTTENDVSTFRFRAKAVYIVTVTKGSRNVVAGTLSGSPFFSRQVAVELPEAVELILVENDLFNHPELRQIPGCPPLDQQRAAGIVDRRLPHWFVRSRGELGFGVATAVAPGGSRSHFREGIRALVEAQAPGVTRPGHSTYMPGVRSRIADHSSPLALRTLINAGPEGRASFHFVHRSWLGPRLVEVEFHAKPSENAALLAERRGRETSTSAGLDNILAHSSGEGGSLQTSGASRQTATRGTTNKVAFSPVAIKGNHQLQFPVAIAAQHSRTNAASSLRERRTWQRTVSTTQFDHVPYTLGVSVRTMPLSDAFIVAAGRAAINGLLAVVRLWPGLPRMSAVSEASRTFSAQVTLRFSGAETPHDPVAEQRRVQPVTLTSAPTPDPLPPTGTVVIDMEVPADISELTAGAAWRPSRPFSVYDFDAVAQLAEAIRTVDPSLARDDRLHSSSSAEGIFLRLAQLARSGRVTVLGPAAVSRLLGGGAGAPGTSLQFALYSPGLASTSRNVGIDRIHANTDSFTTTVDASLTPTFTFDDASPFTHDITNYGGPTVPIVGVAGAQDQSGGGSGQRREIIRFGTSMESADGRGTPGHQITAVAVVRVNGPYGTRWVVGNIEMRTTEAPPVEVAAGAATSGTPDTDTPVSDVLANADSRPANAMSDSADGDDPLLPEEIRSMDGVWFAGATPGRRDEPAFRRLTQAVLAAGAQKHVVIVNTPRLEPQNAGVVAAVRQAADRLAWWDGRGVIVVVFDTDAVLQAWLDQAPVVTARRVSPPAGKDLAALQSVWEVRPAGGQPQLFEERPTAAMFTAAVAMSRASARPPLPRDLARWVSTNTWTQRQAIFEEFRDRLARPELVDAFERLGPVNARARLDSVMTWLEQSETPDHIGLWQVAERTRHDSERIRRAPDRADASSTQREIADRVLEATWAEGRTAREFAAMSVILRRELTTRPDQAPATTHGAGQSDNRHPRINALSTQQMFAYLTGSAPEGRHPQAGRFMLRAVVDRRLPPEDYAALAMATGTTTEQRIEGVMSVAVAAILESARRAPDQHLPRRLDDLIAAVQCVINPTLRLEWVSRLSPGWGNDTPLATSMASNDQPPDVVARLNHLAELIATCGH